MEKMRIDYHKCSICKSFTHFNNYVNAHGVCRQCFAVLECLVAKHDNLDVVDIIGIDLVRDKLKSLKNMTDLISEMRASREPRHVWEKHD